VVDRELPYDCYGAVDSSKDVVMLLLVCCEWVHRCCFAVARVLWVVAIVLVGCGWYVVGRVLWVCYY